MSPRQSSPKPAAAAPDAPPAPELSYEQAREELVDVVHRLESGGVPLAESLALWERGQRLADICQQWLDGARATIERATTQEEHP